MSEIVKFNVEFNRNIFQELSESFNFENVACGRQGAILVSDTSTPSNYHTSSSTQLAYPLVRTTTNYNLPPQIFNNLINEIVAKIQSENSLNNSTTINFNNAMIEIYDNKYKTMKYHTDQMLDLEDNSFIAIFSCYNDIMATRKLTICNKTTNTTTDIQLEHYSCILFSLNYNKNHVHKITPNDIFDKHKDNKWLGITLRLSKTFINFRNSVPYFINTSIRLYLANKQQVQNLYKYKSSENKEIDYEYPIISYTISTGDLIEPKTT